ncbi:hypothetical protein ABW19_dt0204229 [Dactylella cylindrospora]|nr:hypothetical protein ABW19_dt0204229 [Dactylella cylindrospora]
MANPILFAFGTAAWFFGVGSLLSIARAQRVDRSCDVPHNFITGGNDTFRDGIGSCSELSGNLTIYLGWMDEPINFPNLLRIRGDVLIIDPLDKNDEPPGGTGPTRSVTFDVIEQVDGKMEMINFGGGARPAPSISSINALWPNVLGGFYMHGGGDTDAQIELALNETKAFILQNTTHPSDLDYPDYTDEMEVYGSGLRSGANGAFSMETQMVRKRLYIDAKIKEGGDEDLAFARVLMPRLILTGDTYITQPATVEMQALRNASGYFDLDGLRSTSLLLPLLSNSGVSNERFVIRNSPNLRQIDAPLLRIVHGDFEITDNGALNYVSGFQNLSSVSGNAVFRGPIQS